MAIMTEAADFYSKKKEASHARLVAAARDCLEMIDEHRLAVGGCVDALRTALAEVEGA